MNLGFGGVIYRGGGRREKGRGPRDCLGEREDLGAQVSWAKSNLNFFKCHMCEYVHFIFFSLKKKLVTPYKNFYLFLHKF